MNFSMLKITAFALIFALGLAGNILVVAVVATTRKFHSIRFVILASLAVSDILFLILVILFRTISLGYSEWVFGTSYCTAIPVLTSIFVSNTVLHLCVATLETYHAIMHPLTYTLLIRKRSLLRSVVLAWVLPLVYVLPLAVRGIKVQYTLAVGGCELPWKLKQLDTKIIFIVSALIVFVIPFAIIAKLQLKIYSEAKHQVIQIQEQEVDSESRKKKFKNIRAAKDVAFITIAFVISYLPMWIGGFVRLSVPAEQYPDALLLVSLWFTFASTVCNPIIYSFRKRNFLKQTKRLLRWHVICPTQAVAGQPVSD